MNPVHWFLTASSWKLLRFILVIPLLLITVCVCFLVVSSISTRGYGVTSPVSVSVYTILTLTLVSAPVGYVFWLFSIASGLNSIVAERLQRNLTTFKICVVCLVIYPIAQLGDLIIEINGWSLDAIYTAPFHIIALFATLYVIAITARVLKTATLQRLVRGPEYIGDAFLLFFFPFGVWFIQPRVQELYKEQKSGSAVPLDQFVSDPKE